MTGFEKRVYLNRCILAKKDIRAHQSNQKGYCIHQYKEGLYIEGPVVALYIIDMLHQKIAQVTDRYQKPAKHTQHHVPAHQCILVQRKGSDGSCIRR